MKRSALLCLLAAVGAVNAPALAQVDMYLVNTVDLFRLSDADLANNVGSNPSAVALVGDSLYVGGFNNAGQGAIVVHVVQIADIFGAQTLSDLPGSETTLPNFRGFTGMAYAPGHGLLVSYDQGAFGPQNQFRLYDVDAKGGPALLVSSPPFDSPRGNSGPAWDFGYNGEGFDYTFDGQPDGPVVVAMQFSQVGPWGINPTTLSAAIGATIYEPPVGPVLTGDPLDGSQWRDVDVHPTNGAIVARSYNDVVIATRSTDNTTMSRVVIDGGSFLQAVGIQCAFVHGLPSGDLVVYNDRTANALPLDSAVRFVDLQGNPVTVNFLNQDGSPAAFSNGNGIYDFSWDAANNRLAVLDFVNRLCYVFATDAPPPACACDWNGDATLNSQDFFDFLAGFFAGDADFNNDNTTNSQDFFDFLGCFFTGC